MNFASDTIEYPNGLSADERSAIATQVLDDSQTEPDRYARYRLQWLAPIAARYADAGIPVFFVRIPTRPAHRENSQEPSGSLLEIASASHVRLLPAAPYMALERPELFADEDHLNREGSLRFSRLLGRDVAAGIKESAAPASVIVSASRRVEPPYPLAAVATEREG